MSELLNRGLPKWPQMLVRGARVAPEQALEIIRRTDSFFSDGFGGNDREWETLVRRIVGMPDEPDGMADWRAYADAREAWRARWGCIDTEYVSNGWISNAFIFGPSGWCHPDGTISFTFNVGKWPSVESIYDDWKKLAEAFPFLTVAVTLMDGEHCDEGIRPVVSMRVDGGKVRLCEPDDPSLLDGIPDEQPSTPSLEFALARIAFGDRTRERGLDISVIQGWATQLAAA